MKKPDDLIYLNTAAVGLVSSKSIAAAQQFQEGTHTNASGTFFQWMEEGLPNLRAGVAQLIHAHSSQIAFTPNFSYSIQAVVENIRLKVIRILLFKDDYPSLNMPFELGGFDIFYVESKDGFSISINEIIEISKREKIEVIAMSHVQYLSGFTLDIYKLGKFCQEEGIVFILDATQSLSAVGLEFNSLPVDVMISSSYKWLNGGPGSAILAIKDSFMKHFAPRSAGFGSLTVSAKGLDYNPSLKSYEPGHLNPLGLLQLEKGVEQRLETGIDLVERHNSTLIKRLAKGLENTPFKVLGGNEAIHLSTLLCFVAEKKIHERLSKNKIIVTWRRGAVRVSPHFYNTEAEIDYLVEVLKDID